jgi:hypothetical protein
LASGASIFEVMNFDLGSAPVPLLLSPLSAFALQID